MINNGAKRSSCRDDRLNWYRKVQYRETLGRAMGFISLLLTLAMKAILAGG